MAQLSELQTRIEAELKALDLPQTPVELYDPIRYILTLGGKRMRPALTLMGCALFGADPYKAISQAIAIEVFHNFTLVHDDIMDEAPLRRNQPTIHTKWDPNIALLSGDVMLVCAYKELMKCEDVLLRALLESFNKAAIEVCEGQQMDMNFEQRNNVSLSEYKTMIGFKTGVLLASSLQIGALVGGANESDAGLLYRFGLELGLAFQLQDDLLDVFGDPEKFGKQAGGDILANKKTWLLIKAKEISGETERKKLDYWMQSKDFNPTEKVTAVTQLFQKLGVPELAKKEMDLHYQSALAAMGKIAINNDLKQPLLQLAAKLMDRDH